MLGVCKRSLCALREPLFSHPIPLAQCLSCWQPQKSLALVLRFLGSDYVGSMAAIMPSLLISSKCPLPHPLLCRVCLAGTVEHRLLLPHRQQIFSVLLFLLRELSFLQGIHSRILLPWSSLSFRQRRLT